MKIFKNSSQFYAFVILLICPFTLAQVQLVHAPSLKLSDRALTEIVGGENAREGEVPFIASLQLVDGEYFCGASLIRPNWVLTAAHCVTDWYKKNKIVVGAYNQKNLEGAETFTAAKVIIHTGYREINKDYDFALIKLSGSSTVTPVELNSEEIDIAGAAEPILATAAGWGVLGETSVKKPDILQKVEVPLVTQDQCNDIVAYNKRITDRMLCAGFKAGQKDSCSGDSGGPLFIHEDGHALLIGVVSWGKGCARENKYGVYSKVNSQLDWINTQIEQNEAAILTK